MAKKLSEDENKREHLRILQSWIVQGNQALQRVEAEGTALTVRLNQIQSQGQAIQRSGFLMRQQLLLLQADAFSIESELQQRSLSAMSNLPSTGIDGRSTAALESELARLRSQYNYKLGEANQLEATYLQLSQEYELIGQQIQYKAAEREKIVATLAELAAEQAEVMAELNKN